MKNFICELILSCVIAAPVGKPVDELTYGSMLYSYYQQEYQQALLETMVAESQGRRGEDPVRFDLAKGSFAFSERMYDPSRIRYPLKRVGERGSGKWKRISWDEANAEVAHRLKKIRASGHPERFVFH